LYRGSDPPDLGNAVKAYEQAIAAGNSWAMLTLADMFNGGSTLPANPDRARSLIEQAIAAGNVQDGSMALGDFYRKAAPPQPDKALAAYQQAADAGSTSGMLAVAEMLRTGNGVSADPDRAKALIEQAIAAGNIQDGALALGNFYRQSTPPDPDKAVAAYRQAIDAGSTWAMLVLSDMLRTGEGIKADTAEAKALIDKAIAAGNLDAGATALGDYYRRLSPPQPDKAAAAYQKAVDAGSTSAMLTLANMLKTGAGIPADPDRARALIEQAIAAGDVADGALALGSFYREAKPPQTDKAIEAYRQAANTGSTAGMLALAEMLRLTDPDQAKALIEKAIAAGNIQDGALALGNFYRLQDPPQAELALSAYQQAIEAGNNSANLLAAVLESQRANDADSRKAMVDHLVAAAKNASPKDVALEMMHFPANALVASVQELLLQRGQNVGTPDGIYGAKLKKAITTFCRQKKVGDCDPEFITLGLATALLSQ
jgi:TPR repeat protein